MDAQITRENVIKARHDMDELCDLVEALRDRVTGLKAAADDCSLAEDRYALRIRADEAERCADTIESMIREEERIRRNGQAES